MCKRVERERGLRKRSIVKKNTENKGRSAFKQERREEGGRGGDRPSDNSNNKMRTRKMCPRGSKQKANGKQSNTKYTNKQGGVHIWSRSNGHHVTLHNDRTKGKKK